MWFNTRFLEQTIALLDTMVSRLPIWIFLCLAMFMMGFALFLVLRALIGIDEQIEIQFLTAGSLLVAGLICGLTAMLLMVKRQPFLHTYNTSQIQDKRLQNSSAAKLHATGLLLFTGIPLANFLACFYLWVNCRNRSSYLDYQGREAICFQITTYLYLLISLLMAYVIIGAFAIPILLLFHAIATLFAIAYAVQGKVFRYPANITIIARTPSARR